MHNPLPITRATTLSLLRAALEPLPWVLTMWEGGSVAFGRDDELSDIDLQLDVDAGREEDTFAVVESVLAAQGALDYYWEVPSPTWHGYPQRFYHVAGAPEFLYIDLVLRPQGGELKLTEREHHGEPLVHFDKLGIVESTALDADDYLAGMRKRRGVLTASFAMLSALSRKEALRGNPVDAMALYHAMTLRPLVELLRMTYCPLRYTFGMRYLKEDLPPPAVQRLARLSYPADMEQLLEFQAEAAAWFAELAAAPPQ